MFKRTNNYLHISLSPIWRGFAPGFVNYQKGCIRLAAASDKVYQLLAHDTMSTKGGVTGETMIYKTLHRNLNIEHHEHPKKPCMRYNQILSDKTSTSYT
jgi:hypothetical protein